MVETQDGKMEETNSDLDSCVDNAVTPGCVLSLAGALRIWWLHWQAAPILAPWGGRSQEFCETPCSAQEPCPASLWELMGLTDLGFLLSSFSLVCKFLWQSLFCVTDSWYCGIRLAPCSMAGRESTGTSFPGAVSYPKIHLEMVRIAMRIT